MEVRKIGILEHQNCNDRNERSKEIRNKNKNITVYVAGKGVTYYVVTGSKETISWGSSKATNKK